MKHAIWQDPDGHIVVDIPAAGVTLKDAAAKTEHNHLAAGRTRLADHDGPFPSRIFRNCWRESAGKIGINMPLARIQRMAEIRAERDALLDESDKDKARLDDVGTANQKQAMATYRQALRDLPASVDVESITTPEELEAFAPAMPSKPK